MKTNRRKFFRNTAISAAGIMLGNTLVASNSERRFHLSSFDIMKNVMKYRKFDSHAHVWSIKDTGMQLDIADKLGIDRLQISKPVTNWSGTEPEDPKTVRKCNDLIISAMKQHPDRYTGFFTLNPVYKKESLEETGSMNVKRLKSARISMLTRVVATMKKTWLILRSGILVKTESSLEPMVHITRVLEWY